MQTDREFITTLDHVQIGMEGFVRRMFGRADAAFIASAENPPLFDLEMDEEWRP